jgi:GNAT superfamily N-acetyltransferase
VAGGVLIRELRRADAEAVAELHLAVNPHQLETAERVWFWASRGLEREQWGQWVAEADGEIVGSAWAAFEWSVPTPGRGRFWVAVPRERRRRGIGSALYGVVDEYLRGRGAWRARTNVDGDPDGERFVRARGFVRGGVDRVSELDLHAAELPEPQVPPGFQLEPLGRVRDRVEELFAVCAAGELETFGDEPGTAVTLEDWKLDDFGVPDLSDEGSFVVLDAEKVVSLVFLCVDRARRFAYNQMTATLPQFRRRGLALAAKIAAARWAAANGFERIVTENDARNDGMLAINGRLGYRPLYDQVKWFLEWERPPDKSGQHL